MSQYAWDNCPAAVRDQVARLVSGFRAIAGDNLLGVYLHGSLALGFNPLRSDLDILAVTHAALGADAGRRWLRSSSTFRSSPIPSNQLRSHRDLHPAPSRPFDFHYGESCAQPTQRSLRTTTSRGPANRTPTRTWPHASPSSGSAACASVGSPSPKSSPTFPRTIWIPCGDVLSDEFGLASATRRLSTPLLNGCRTSPILSADKRSPRTKAASGRRHLPPAYRAAVEQALVAYRNLAGDEGMDSAAALALAEYLRSRITAHFSDESPATNVL